MYLKPTVEVVVMTESFQILAGSVSEVKEVDSNLLGDDNFIWGGIGSEVAR